MAQSFVSMSFKKKIERARKEAGDPSDRAKLKKILTKLFDESACPAWPTDGILTIFPHETTCRIKNVSGIDICGTVFSNTSNLRSHVFGVHLPENKVKRAKHLRDLELFKERMGAFSFGCFNEALNVLENRIKGDNDYEEKENNGREIRKHNTVARKKNDNNKGYKSAERITDSDDGGENDTEGEQEEEEENVVEEDRESSPLSSVGNLTDSEEEVVVPVKRYATREKKN